MNDNPMPQAPSELSGMTVGLWLWYLVTIFVMVMIMILGMAKCLDSDISEFQQACEAAGGTVLSGKCLQEIRIKPKLKVMT